MSLIGDRRFARKVSLPDMPGQWLRWPSIFEVSAITGIASFVILVTDRVGRRRP